MRAGQRRTWRAVATATLVGLMAVTGFAPSPSAAATEVAPTAQPQSEEHEGHDHAETFGHPVAPIDVQLIQPDGATFAARPWGHGAMTGYETLDGYALAKTESGEWRYAEGQDANGHLKAGSRRPDQSPPPARGPKHQRPSANNGPMLEQPPAEDPTPAPSNGPSSVPQGGVNTGTHRSLVILAQFSDQNSVGSTAAEWNSRYFGTTSSVADFYTDASYGNFTFAPATETSGTANDGIIDWVTLGSHPNTGQNSGAANAQVTKDAIVAANPFVDFASYDTSPADGVVKPNELHITVIVAGFEASYGGAVSASNCGGGAPGTGKTMWGHRWAIPLSVGPPSVDGKSVGGWGYTQFGEMHCGGALDNGGSGHLATVGIMAHEMGHDIGWPDLYDTTPGDGTSAGVGNWSVMGGGSWGTTAGNFQGSSPSLPDPFSKYYQGWITPTPYTVGAATNLLTAATNSGVALLGSNPNGVDWSFGHPTGATGTGEYFLVENRQLTGYDASLPGCGILVWHIDETRSSGGDANGTTTRKLVDLEEADGFNHLDSNTNRGDAGDPFPGTGTKTLWDNTTSPNSKYYSGAASGLGVELNTTTCADTMSLDLNGGVAPSAPTVTGLSPMAGGLNGGSVTVFGSGFVDGGTTVNFKKGGVNNLGSNVSVTSSISLTVDAPSNTAGLADVLVTTAGGTSANTTNDNYTYVGSPLVTSLNPKTGFTTGGNNVIINGSGFRPGETTVTFDGTPANVVTSTSTSSITVTAPAHSAGVVRVAVSTIGGTSPDTSNDNYTYTTPPTITVTSPNGGESFAAGSAQPITWTSTDLAPTATVKIHLMRDGELPFQIISSTANDGTHPWPIQAATEPAGDYKIRVMWTLNSSVHDFSDDDFSVTGPLPPSLTVISPNGGEELDAGTEVSVTWSSTSIGPTANVKLELLRDSGPTLLIASTTPNDGERPWQILGTQVTGSDYRIKVTAATNAAIHDVSDATFTINGAPPPPPPPTITDVDPNEGPLGGRTIWITGTNFTPGATVKFLVGTTATNATNVLVDAGGTDITATLPSRTTAAVGRIVVTTAGGSSADSAADNFTYWGAPTVTKVTPNRGDPAGGETVTITGANLVPGQTAISFGGSPASIVAHTSPTSLTVTAPAHALGAVHINAVTPGGTSANAAANVYTYALVPTITSIAPNEGGLGAQIVSITGTNFVEGATTVKFLVGTTATNGFNVLVNSPTLMSATLPARTAPAIGSVIVTTSGGSSTNTAADDYRYFARPTVTKLTPAKGDLAGGNHVTVTGTNMVPGETTFDFGGVPATVVTHTSLTSAVVSAPAHSAGPVHVTATTPGGSSAEATGNVYNYALLPTVVSLTPSEGGLGANIVTVIGTNFVEGATTAKFLVGTTATNGFNLLVNSPTQLSFTLPARTTPAIGRVVIATAAGDSADSPGDSYRYFAKPTVTKITPAKGDPAGGNNVTITGTNMVPGETEIFFGTTPAAIVSHPSVTSVTVEAPSSELGGEGTGPVHVRATTPGGTSADATANVYTYALAPSVTAVSPNEATLSAQQITVTGTNFTVPATVKFFVGTASTSGTNVIVDSPTSLRVTTPSRTSPAIASVIVTTTGGTSANTAADDYRTFARPTISSLSPNHYWNSGGNEVVVNGMNLIPGKTEIRFAGELADIVSHTTNSSVRVVAPASTHVGLVDVTATTPGGTNLNGSGDNYNYLAAPNADISGWATQASDGEPAVGVCVRYFSLTGGTSSGNTVTDANGGYVFTEVPIDTYEVLFEDCAGTLGGWAREGASVSVDPEWTNEVSPVLDRGAGQITGTALVAGSAPSNTCAGLYETDKGYGMLWQVNSSNGTYTLYGVHPDLQYKVAFVPCGGDSGLANQYWDHTTDWNAATLLDLNPSEVRTGIDGDLVAAAQAPPSGSAPDLAPPAGFAATIPE